MTFNEAGSDRANAGERQGQSRFDSSSLRELYNHPSFTARMQPSSAGSQNVDYLDLSADPYSSSGGRHNGNGGGASQFDKQHPWRAKVLHGDDHLLKELHKDAGHLNGHYDELKKEIKSIRADEEREAKANGGHITKKEENQLLRREHHVQEQFKSDLKHSHHSGHHKPGHHSPEPQPVSPVSPEPQPVSPEPQPVSPEPQPVSPTPSPGQPGTDSGLLLGTAVRPGDVGAHSYQQAIQNFDSKTGVHQNLQMLYCNENLGAKPDLAAMQADVKAGVTPVLSLRTTKYADVTSGKDDAYLQMVANDLKQVGGTVYLRPNWEMDGGQRQQYGTPKQFVAAWQYMHNFMQKAGVNNVKWVWTPDAPAFDSKVPGWSSPAKEYYPGSQYVDVIGADGYSGLNGESYKTPQQIFSSAVNFANQEGKPFMIAETGVNSSFGPAKDAQFIQEMTSFIEANPDVKALSWFSEGSNSIFASPQEAAAFAQMEKALGAPPN